MVYKGRALRSSGQGGCRWLRVAPGSIGERAGPARAPSRECLRSPSGRMQVGGRGRRGTALSESRCRRLGRSRRSARLIRYSLFIIFMITGVTARNPKISSLEKKNLVMTMFCFVMFCFYYGKNTQQNLAFCNHF